MSRFYMLTVKSVIQRPLATFYISQDSYIFATLYLRYIRFISGWSGAEIKHTRNFALPKLL